MSCDACTSTPTPAPTPSPVPTPSGGGCCRFGTDCADCGLDGTGWCHASAANCADCTGMFDPAGVAPACSGPSPTPTPIAPSPSSPPPGSPIEQHGALRIQGIDVVGAHGSPVILRGMSMFWSQWMGKYWNADVVRWLAEDWQISMIRLAMGADQGGYVENPGEKDKVITCVDAAIAAGIYVVIDWHDHMAEQHTDQAKGFFDEMARRYGSYANVLFEIYNEPINQPWSTIKWYAEQVIPVIRAHSTTSSSWALPSGQVSQTSRPAILLEERTWHILSISMQPRTESPCGVGC